MTGEAEAGPRFVGRPEAVEALLHRLEEVRAGTGGVTLLVGDAGVGKSTLVRQLARECRSRGVRVLIGQAPRLDNPPPFSLIHSAFGSGPEDPLRSPDGTSSLEDEGSLLDLAPRLAEAASPEKVGIEQRLLKALDETEERGKRSRDRALGRIADRFSEYARKGPTVLILDELRRADESSIAAVEYLAQHLPPQPLWILATTRPPTSLSEGGRIRLEEFKRTTRPEEIVLRPLAPTEVADFLHAVDPAQELPSDEVAKRFAESSGNPLLLEQFARRRNAGLPVRGVPGSKAAPLDQATQRILDVAAVLGPEFSFQLLQGVSGESEPQLRKVVDELLSWGALFERRDGSLAFPDDRLRERAYGHLTASTRRILHQRAAEIREAAGPGTHSQIFDLARDFYLGEGDPKAVDYNRIAAEIAEGAAAPDIAREFLSNALESQREVDPTNPDREAELVLELARVSSELGRLAEAERTLREFLERPGAALSPRVQNTLGVYLIRVLTARGEMGQATELAHRILSSPEMDKQPLVRVAANAQLRMSLYYHGRYAEALEQNQEVIRLARAAGDERALMYAQLWRAGCLAMMGQGDQAIAEARVVAAAFDRLGTVSESAAGHLFLGNMLADNRSTPQIRQEALAELQKTIRLAARAQDPRRLGWAFYHSAELLHFEGRARESEENAQQAHDTLARVGDRAGQAASLKVKGQLALDRGALEEADAFLTEAERLLQGLNQPLYEIDVGLRRAQLSAARGDRAAAIRQAADLERRNLRALRPDLLEEFDQLRKKLSAA